MIDREPIPMPTPAQRDRAVAAILAQGLPPREPLGKRILRTARTLPPSVLFFGVGDCLFLAVLLALVCLPPAAWAVAQREALPSLLFLFSPALYALLQGLTQWKEEMSHMLEWKQACRISLPTLTAWRMLVFGGVAVVLCVPGNLLLWQLRGGAGLPPLDAGLVLFQPVPLCGPLAVLPGEGEENGRASTAAGLGGRRPLPSGMAAGRELAASGACGGVSPAGCRRIGRISLANTPYAAPGPRRNPYGRRQ